MGPYLKSKPLLTILIFISIILLKSSVLAGEYIDVYKLNDKELVETRIETHASKFIDALSALALNKIGYYKNNGGIISYIEFIDKQEPGGAPHLYGGPADLAIKNETNKNIDIGGQICFIDWEENKNKNAEKGIKQISSLLYRFKDYINDRSINGLFPRPVRITSKDTLDVIRKKVYSTYKDQPFLRAQVLDTISYGIGDSYIDNFWGPHWCDVPVSAKEMTIDHVVKKGFPASNNVMSLKRYKLNSGSLSIYLKGRMYGKDLPGFSLPDNTAVSVYRNTEKIFLQFEEVNKVTIYYNNSIEYWLSQWPIEGPYVPLSKPSRLSK